MSSDIALQSGSSECCAFFLARLDPRLEPLQPLLQAWSMRASERWHEAGAPNSSTVPWGINILADIARDLGWEVAHRRPHQGSDSPVQPWPLGWQRIVDFSVQPQDRSVRWAFILRHLFVSPDADIDIGACAAALTRALGAARRLPYGPKDTGMAVLELRISLQAAGEGERTAVAKTVDRLHELRLVLGATGLLIHAAPTSDAHDPYRVHVTASLLIDA